MDDAGIVRNIVSGKAVRIAGAIVVFMIKADDGEIVDEDASALEDADSNGGLGFHDGSFGIGEATVFR